MSTKKKLLQAAAGAAGGAVLDVDEVFSTYLYDGDSQDNRDIVNNIDLSGEGGLVWTKRRDTTAHNFFIDTERGTNKYILSNTTSAENSSYTNILTSFNNNGYEIGSSSFVNNSAGDFVSWTFRKAPKFFDVVTWTGTGGARTISHNLNTTVGTIIVKQRNASNNWFVYHRSLSTGSYPDAEDNFLMLNLTNAANDTTLWNSTAPTSTDFTVSNTLNTSSNTYVAYLFAHNNGDGDFGPDSDQDIIKCGSYTGTGANNNSINLGFEPQWLMWKNTSTSGHDWHIVDTMRGFTAEGIGAKRLEANTSDVEATSGSPYMDISSTGFVAGSTSASANKSGDTYIYMAIRRGPLAEPENATDVFAMDTWGSTGDGLAPAFRSSFPVDMALERQITTSDHWGVSSRLTQEKFTRTSSTAAEASGSAYSFDYMNGWYDTTSTNSAFHGWMWKRAPSYFDVVTFTGTGSTQAINHNLGVVPEMMWLKKRSGSAGWNVYHSGLNSGTDPEDYYLSLNAASDETNNSNRWNDTAPTATQFTVNGAITDSGSTQIMYLFASLDGISKVSHYTGNGVDGRQIDCGFSSGARFVLIKRVDQNEDWMVFDTERGIVSGNDSYLRLNLSNAQNTGTDLIDPYSSGFAVNNDAKVNTSGGRYVFYAIA